MCPAHRRSADKALLASQVRLLARSIYSSKLKKNIYMYGVQPTPKYQVLGMLEKKEQKPALLHLAKTQ